jgi:BirA family transcriptional regulator, biotin operon repressor / biotin---[acetyl-CoA-carboxylase] ligase
MTERPDLPPIFDAYAVNSDVDPFERAVSLAKRNTDPGTFIWSERTDVYRSALILAPERSLEESLPVVLVALLGLGDALGALIPPVTSVTFGWPDRIEINGGMVGDVRLTVAETPNPTAIPDWLVIGFNLVNEGTWAQEESGRRHRTTLFEEGCQIDHLDLLEALSRHLLAWINRWQSDGILPVQQAWMSRAPEIGKHIEINVDQRMKRGTFKGLNEQGGVELVDQGRHQMIPLVDVLLTAKAVS